MAENKFQRIKRLTKEYETNTGNTAIRLSIGQPSGPALARARRAAASAIMSDQESMHEYQDNGSPGVYGFANRFVHAHLKHGAPTGASYLPIPGIKPMLGIVIQAMGGWESRPVKVFTLTNPGYPTPADQCSLQANVRHWHLTLQMDGDPIRVVSDSTLVEIDDNSLVMVNFPHNPTGRIATYEFWCKLGEYCAERGAVLFNDAAYTILAHNKDSYNLSEVGWLIEGLEWAEAFSASKAGNFTGWRVGAMLGSSAFMAKIAGIKGNTDSGFAAPLAAGVLAQFEEGRNEIYAVSDLYARRLEILNHTLNASGMRIATQPEAGFFALYNAPKQAFGQKTPDGEAFNTIMIEKTGIVGVPFDGWIRYAVCTEDVEALAPMLGEAFRSANVQYY